MRKPLDPLTDHLFGDVDKPKKGAAFAIDRLSGVHHWSAKTPAIPQPGDEVTLHVTTSSELPVTGVKVAFTSDEWQTSRTLDASQTAQRWDTLLWRWLTDWQSSLPAQSDGTTLRYQVWAELTPTQPGAVAPRVYADNQVASPEKASQFAIWYSQNDLPEWSKDARVYQIFLDRFHPGDGKAWSQTSVITQPMGGTLRGVIDKLDHIQSFGFNAIWLSPIFKSPTHHGYDTSDYNQVEPRLGTLDDLKELIGKAHAKGMRIILDFVANHVSSEHPALKDALQDPQNPTKEWFFWSKWPKYQAYFNLASMPQLNLSYGSPARAHLLEVARYWLKLGVDGYRLDYAYGPEPDFWVDFRHACSESNPQCWTFGEVVSGADVQASFAGGMHGTLDFLTCQALRESIAARAWPLSRLAGYLENSAKAFPAGFSRPAFIDNHDMNRFLFMAGGDERLLDIALTLLYLLPQPLIVYAGSDTALNQPRSIHQNGALGFDESRVPMNWHDAGKFAPRQALFERLTTLREKYHSMRDVTWQIWSIDDQKQVAVWQLRSINQPILSLAVNLSDEIRQAEVPTTPETSRLLQLSPRTCQILETP
ncbi:MAG: alpha-amylase family glycosyl hydrolase [Anaerolineaceae bacterium]